MSIQLVGEVNLHGEALGPRELRTLKAATRSIMGGDATRMKNALRREVIRAGLGERLAFAIRSSIQVGDEIVETRVFDKAWVKDRPGGGFNLLTFFTEGGTISAARGSMVFVPKKGFERASRTQRLDPAAFDFIPLPGRRIVAVVPKGQPLSALIGFLVHEVTERGRLRFSAALRVRSDLAARVNQDWGRRLLASAAA